MTETSVTHSTFVIERSFPCSPERVFAAFSDPATKRRWMADAPGRVAEEYVLDFRIGGTERARYRMGENTPFPGTPLSNDTVYQDIVSNQRIVIAYTMTLGSRRISASLATFEFVPTDDGTDLVFTDQGAYFEGADGPQMRQAGWTSILDRLATVLAG
jgi:uncharacterized protein YndB with AHSA1/START domain